MLKSDTEMFLRLQDDFDVGIPNGQAPEIIDLACESDAEKFDGGIPNGQAPEIVDLASDSDTESSENHVSNELPSGFMDNLEDYFRSEDEFSDY
jgi:hypothetical protein